LSILELPHMVVFNFSPVSLNIRVIDFLLYGLPSIPIVVSPFHRNIYPSLNCFFVSTPVMWNGVVLDEFGS